MRKNKKKGPNIRLRAAVFAFFGGLVMAGAAYLGFDGNLALAASQLVILWSVGLWIYFGKSDLVETMRQTDERQKQIVGHAREYTLEIMGVVILCDALYEIASGKAFGPFIALGSLTGLVFLVSILVLRAKS